MEFDTSRETYADDGGPRPANAPAGWYPIPGTGDQQYWDGIRWTEHRVSPNRPRTGLGSSPSYPRTGVGVSPRYPRTDSDTSAGPSVPDMELWGWLGAFFFPPVAVIMGIKLMGRRPGSGTVMLMVGSIGCVLLLVASWYVWTVYINPDPWRDFDGDLFD